MRINQVRQICKGLDTPAVKRGHAEDYANERYADTVSCYRCETVIVGRACSQSEEYEKKKRSPLTGFFALRPFELAFR